MAELEKLDTLAARINEEHRACETAANAALTHSMSAGELLMEAKGQLSHGAFGPWLTENFARSDRAARAYMRVYSHREELEVKRQSSATLSLDGALRALCTPKDAPEARRPATLEELEGRAENALSKARGGALGMAEHLDAIRRGRGYEHLGYASFAVYLKWASSEYPTKSFPMIPASRCQSSRRLRASTLGV